MARTIIRARLRDRVFGQLRREHHVVRIEPAALSIDAAGLWRVSFPAGGGQPFLAALHDGPQLGHDRVREVAAWAAETDSVRFRIYVELETHVSDEVMAALTERGGELVVVPPRS